MSRVRLFSDSPPTFFPSFSSLNSISFRFKSNLELQSKQRKSFFFLSTCPLWSENFRNWKKDKKNGKRFPKFRQTTFIDETRDLFVVSRFWPEPERSSAFRTLPKRLRFVSSRFDLNLSGTQFPFLQEFSFVVSLKKIGSLAQFEFCLGRTFFTDFSEGLVHVVSTCFSLLGFLRLRIFFLFLLRFQEIEIRTKFEFSQMFSQSKNILKKEEENIILSLLHLVLFRVGL